jgi:hypothetical protein
VLGYRFAVIGAGFGLWIAAGSSALALTRDRPGPLPGDHASIQESHAIVGFGFGFGPWWGPNDYYPPPAYYYPAPVYSVPPAMASPLQSSPTVSNGCREFQSTMIVDGQARLARGLACPQADGTWRIVQ